MMQWKETRVETSRRKQSESQGKEKRERNEFDLWMKKTAGVEWNRDEMTSAFVQGELGMQGKMQRWQRTKWVQLEVQ